MNGAAGLRDEALRAKWKRGRGRLGNNIEAIIGSGNSGGPALIDYNGGFALVGINTFTEGCDGRFGDIGGGVVLDPYWDWISETTGLALVPDPSTFALWLSLAASFLVIHRRRNTTEHNKRLLSCLDYASTRNLENSYVIAD